MTSRTESARRILGIWRKLVELRLDTGREGLTFACSRRPWAGVARDGGCRWKGQNRKIVPLSPYVEKPLNSKVTKGFVPELRSRKCFSCSEIPVFYVIYIWTVYVHFIHSRIWLWYKIPKVGGEVSETNDKETKLKQKFHLKNIQWMKK